MEYLNLKKKQERTTKQKTTKKYSLKQRCPNCYV